MTKIKRKRNEHVLNFNVVCVVWPWFDICFKYTNSEYSVYNGVSSQYYAFHWETEAKVSSIMTDLVQLYDQQKKKMMSDHASCIEKEKHVNGSYGNRLILICSFLLCFVLFCSVCARVCVYVCVSVRCSFMNIHCIHMISDRFNQNQVVLACF